MSYLEREYIPPSGPIMPFGSAGVVGAMAALLGLVGLLLPTTLTESIAFQMYLDTMIASAVPPFGWAAKIVTGLLLAVAGGLLGYGLARLFGVRSGGGSIAQLLARLRGIGAQDDDDAPVLRSADRHPDAPARRPFSVATDIPARPAEASEWDQYWQNSPSDAPDDDGELLLTSNFADVQPAPQPAYHSMPASEAEPYIPAPFASPPYVEESFDEDVFAPLMPAPMSADAASAFAHDAPVDSAIIAPAPHVAAPQSEAVDLSVARLDELLARLEAGLASRSGVSTATTLAAASPAKLSPDALDDAPAGTPPLPQDSTVAKERELLFPQDPALAAALATLRRMNQHVG
ncbi:MAG: hypothetical protein AABZ45_08445 [Pseudomonadota bacterium]